MPYDPAAVGELCPPLARVASRRQSLVRPTRVGPILVVLFTTLVAQGFVLSGTVFTAVTTGAVSVSWVAAQILAIAASGVLVWKVSLVARYRSIRSVEDDLLPTVAVIVPAYNEGEQIYDTLMSLAASDYPRSRLELVAVDDGSLDETWVWIERARDVLGDAIETVRCPRNRGKRFALHEGFAQTRAEVLVTVNADSEVLPETLRNLVSPLVVDPTLGAIAGNVRARNEAGGPLARILGLSVIHALEFMRASESEVDAVQCCPGALAAFRRTIVERVEGEWMAQTFFGRPASIGEDRALTNLVLREGHGVRFQASAIVLTDVPEDLPRLCGALLRRARGDVRELVVTARFIFRRFRFGPKAGARVNFLWSAVGTLLGPIGLAALIEALFTRHRGGRTR